jgi:hypothetical protein
MRPTGGFAQTRHAIRIRHVKLSIAFVAVHCPAVVYLQTTRGGLKDAAGVSQMAENVLLLPVGRKPIDRTGRCCPRPLRWKRTFGAKDVGPAHKPRSGLA